MVRGMFKSRTLRRVFRKTPGGRNTLTYRKRKPKNHVCSECKKVLPGVPRERPYKMMTLAKTHKRPERPYGGVLCSSCSREKIRKQVRT
ncbi:50S ribosomal protein L34e [Candidatus Woesearchaeota archaeon]|nr:50S ribosomal protein L34e [Candidatus Woesearchaeota archaeon]